MRPLVLLTACLFLGAVLAGCTGPSDNGFDGDVPAEHAVIETTHGDILVQFYCDEAPLTVENFYVYAQDGFYEGTIFHRIIQGFMIQGGGFTPDGQQKQTRDPVQLEYNVPNERGTMAMARTGDPNSATSQFFINTVDNSGNLGPGGADQFGYTVFARVVEGMDVVDAIAAEPTGQGPRPGMGDWPEDPPVIEGVRVGAPCGEIEFVPTEYVPFWLLNTHNESATFDLKVEAPEGWNVTLNDESAELGPAGQPGDSFATFLTLRDYEVGTSALIRVDIVDRDDPKNTTVLEIRSVAATTASGSGSDGNETNGIMAGLMTTSLAEDGVWETVLTMEPVSGPGDRVTISYVGSFDDGEVFDSGSFPTTVRSGETVPGFDTGLLGIALGETVNLRFPPDLGYGYNPPGHMAQFAGQWLNFEVTLDGLT